MDPDVIAQLRARISEAQARYKKRKAVPRRDRWKQDCIDRITRLIDENPQEMGIRSWSNYLSSIINWMWGSKIPGLRKIAMDIDGVVHYDGGVLFLEAKNFLDTKPPGSKASNTLEMMSMTLERLGNNQELFDRFMAGEVVKKKVDPAGWLSEHGSYSTCGQKALFERLVCLGEGWVEAVFPWGPSLEEMEGFGTMRYVDSSSQIEGSCMKKRVKSYEVECQLHRGAGVEDLDRFISEWKQRVDERNEDGS